MEPLPAEPGQGERLAAAVVARLVQAFHVLHLRLPEADRAAVAAPYLRTSCRRIPLCAAPLHSAASLLVPAACATLLPARVYMPFL